MDIIIRTYPKMKAKIIKHKNAKVKRIEAAFANEYFITSNRKRENFSHMKINNSNNLNVAGNKCAYATASFSSLRSYYALTCSGPDPMTITINDENHQPVLTWKDYSFLRQLLSRRLMPQQRDFNITVNGYDSRVRLLLPPNFDENESYPLLVNM